MKMIKEWEGWKVGIAGTRKAMFRKRTVKKGKLYCQYCGTDGHFALHAGGKCGSCHEPARINRKYAAHKLHIEPKSREQLPATLHLRDICNEIISRNNIPATRFGDLVGIPRSTFYVWFRGEMTEEGQLANNKKVLDGLRALGKQGHSI